MRKFILILCCLCTSQTMASVPVLQDRACIAHAVYHEARGEPFKGQVAVAYVVLNRATTRHQSPCFIVYEPYQFTNIHKTQPDKDSIEWLKAEWAADEAHDQTIPDPTHGAEYFYAPKKVPTPRWAFVHRLTAVINNHRFYK